MIITPNPTVVLLAEDKCNQHVSSFDALNQDSNKNWEHVRSCLIIMQKVFELSLLQIASHGLTLCDPVE